MSIYLVQHAESKSKEENPERPLTDEGFANITKIASYAQDRIDAMVDIIFHSGKLRAEQTAEVLGGYLEPSQGVKKSEGLDPMADPIIWVRRLSKTEENIMFVGHLPHLGRLAGLLLNGDDSKNVLNIQNAGIIKLSKRESNGWMLDWMIVPSIV